MIRRVLASIFWFTNRWKLVTAPAPTVPTIFIGAPHTSNWDFVYMLAITWTLGIKIRWLGKSSLFTGWRGPLMRGLGGIAVDRDRPGDVVDEIVARIRDGEVFALVITPDGTRTNTGFWKSGFYRIAERTGMPLTLGFMDRTTKTAGLGLTINVTGDVSADMDRIRTFYCDKARFTPSKRREPRLRDEEPR